MSWLICILRKKDPVQGSFFFSMLRGMTTTRNQDTKNTRTQPTNQLNLLADPSLRQAILSAPSEKLAEILANLPENIVDLLLAEMSGIQEATRNLEGASGANHVPSSITAQAQILEPNYTTRPHLDYLSAKLTQAVARVEAGENVHMTVSMPPRTGKSFTISTFTPTWLLHKHPDWRIGLISHSPVLASSWGRLNRRMIEEHGSGEGASGKLNLTLARDARAVSHWETSEGGGLLSRSVKQALAGFGFKVLIVDDAVKDIASATNPRYRQEMWDWWKADVLSRMQPPYLLVVVGTRWHTDDLIGRILSPDYEGDPSVWEQVTFPAIATDSTVDPVTGRDILGRAPGDPLISPLVQDETREQALARWATIRENSGSYFWSALYQQSPTPDDGGLINVDSIRFYSNDPSHVVDGSDKVRLLDENLLNMWRRGIWVDSWDTSFKGSDTSDFVVGQRWVSVGKDRFLVGQQRGRFGYTQTLEAMRSWLSPGSESLLSPSPFGAYVTTRLVEEKANGAALIEKLKGEVSGVVGVNPRMGKEARARVVSPEIEGFHVYLPHPDIPGFDWVHSLISELRNFPNDKHDDQVDALTQALSHLKVGAGGVLVPSGVVQTNPVGGSLGLGGAGSSASRLSQPLGRGSRGVSPLSRRIR